MPRSRNPDTPTAAARQKAYRDRHQVRRTTLNKVAAADLDEARQDGETDRAVVARALRALVSR